MRVAGCLLPLLWCLACSQTAPPQILRTLGDVEQGEGTYYDATGDGMCMFGESPNDLAVAAVNEAQYDASLCGACLEVTGPLGSTIVRVVDMCPTCNSGDVDLSEQSFARIARVDDGRVPITWKVVSCSVQGPLRFHIREGSSQWWTAIQVRNHRVPVLKLEWWKDNRWVALERQPHNDFVAQEGVGTGSFKLRTTSWEGQTLEDTLPGVQEGRTFDGAAQFP